ncbi:hypothetical protein ACFYW8_33310 [Streptomyces sp. NPDC002742]|uniref:hypothetical protein n=1 Tax=Streptomyces sp. NPDC002742 TaxID=3364663 RepID=UPI0036CBDCFD
MPLSIPAGITYSEHWGPPGQAVAVLGLVLDLQAALVAALARSHPGRSAPDHREPTRHVLPNRRVRDRMVGPMHCLD